MAVYLSPLPQGFGTEISGFDLSQGRSTDDISALRNALDDYGLLVFRWGGQLSADRQAEIVGWFGTVGAGEFPEDSPATMMDNATDRGRAKLPFHCDITFFEHPLEGISLHPLALPSCDTSTIYVSNVLGWDSLSPEIKLMVKELSARHYYQDDGKMGDDALIFEAWHPICKPHPRTGRPLLFVTEHHTDRVAGYSDTEGDALLQKLFRHLYAAERRYEHIWRLGDLVIWDNLSIQHARTREAIPEDGPRILQRVWFGEHGYMKQAAEVRSRQQASAVSGASGGMTGLCTFISATRA